ncbi:MAG: GNAT family N-acetyltransferase [Paracoccaceae bacterium]
MLILGTGESEEWIASTFPAIDQILAADWDLCVGTDEPLLIHRHLLALEESGIAAVGNGFEPAHVVLRDAAGAIVAAAPAYLKNHSRGELGVDLGLSLAHTRSVGSYYPKLQVEVPMTPFSGSRLLVRPGVDRNMAVQALIRALQVVAVSRGASSVQITHLEGEEDCGMLAQAGYAIAETNSYVWRAGVDTSFEGMLHRMKSSARSEIKRHRRRLEPLNLKFRHYRGSDLSEHLASLFFERYRANFDHHNTPMWLNFEYFIQVFRTMPDCVELSVSFFEGSWVGAVMTVVTECKGYTLYWGQTANINYLHFEQVIYRGIERALVIGLQKLDFGPTGAHKAERGLGIEPVRHALWFRDPAFEQIAAMACARKVQAAKAERATESARLPFLASA